MHPDAPLDSVPLACQDISGGGWLLSQSPPSYLEKGMFEVSERVAIFIDGGYTAKVAKKNEIRIDYGKLAEVTLTRIASSIHGPVNLLRTYFYDCLPYQGSPPTQDERDRMSKKRRFIDGLQGLPDCTVRLGSIKRQGQNSPYTYVQKGVDLMIGLEIVSLSVKNQISYACLFSGDADLLPAIQTAQSEGVKVWLAHDPASSANELRLKADNRLVLDQGFLMGVSRSP